MASIRVLSVSLCLLFPSILLADDFRGSSWGDTMKVVKENEKTKLINEGNNALYYTTTLAGIDMLVRYLFSNGRLVQGSYINQESYMNDNNFIDDFNKLKDLLVKKYGEPDIDETIWRNDLYKSDRSNWGMAISVGHLMYSAQWETERTNVVTGLMGENFDISHGVVYDEQASKEEREKQNEEKAIDQL